MNLKYSIWISLILGFSFSLQATTSCPAPTPNLATLNQSGADYINLSWEEVPGAVSYLINIEDPDGTSISSQTSTENTHIQQELLPGLEYSFFISASYCENGPYGSPLLVKVKTSIIIIDDIVQLSCPGATTSTHTASSGSQSTLILDPKVEGCFLIHVETTSLDPNISFDLGLTLGSKGQLVLGDYIGNPIGFNLVKNNSVFGLYSPLISNHTIPLFELDANTLNGGKIKASFTWAQDVIITITRCSNCNFGNKSLSHDLTSEPLSPAISLYPNPAKSTLVIEMTNNGHLDIWDVAGRNWHSEELKNETNHHLQLSVDSWPKGTYILRWHQTNSPPIVQYFLKL